MPSADHQLPESPSRLSRARRWLVKETVASRLACIGVGVGALLALLGSILCSRHGLAYDEVFHLTTAKALLRVGLSREFFMGTPWSAPGPLYAFVQVAGAPLTGLRPPGIRLVNFACVLGMVLLLWRTLQARAASAPADAALGVLAAPIGWIVFGLALTETPAMLCAAASLLLTVLWQKETGSPLRRDALAIGAGLLLGGAVIGRQVYLVLLPVIALLAGRGAVRPAILQLAAAAVMPAALFALWGGLAPAEMRFASSGIRPSSGLLSFAYTGLITLVLAPRFFRGVQPNWALGIAAAMLVINLTLGLYTRIPLRFLMEKHLPGMLFPFVTRVYGSALLILAALFIASAAKHLWERRADRGFVFACAGTLALAATPLKITHVWDVRYVTVVLPFLVVTLSDWVTPNFFRAIRLTLGVMLAFFYLQFELTISWDEEHPPTMRELFSRLQQQDEAAGQALSPPP